MAPIRLFERRLLALAALTVACATRATPAPTPPPRAAAQVADSRPTVRVVPVERRTVRAVATATGALTPGVSSSVVARASGVITQVLVDTSTVVQAGQDVAAIDAHGRRPERVRATISGVVMERRVSPGDPVEADRTVVMTLADLSTMLGRAELAERYVALLHPGDPIEVQVDAMPGRVFQSVVQRVEPAVTPAHTLPFEFVLQNSDRMLRPGMTAVVRVVLDRREGALVVPRDAVVRRDGRTLVFVDDAGHARSHEVALGLDEGAAVEAVSGVAEGDPVLVPGESLHDGEEFAASR